MNSSDNPFVAGTSTLARMEADQSSLGSAASTLRSWTEDEQTRWQERQRALSLDNEEQRATRKLRLFRAIDEFRLDMAANPNLAGDFARHSVLQVEALNFITRAQLAHLINPASGSGYSAEDLRYFYDNRTALEEIYNQPLMARPTLITNMAHEGRIDEDAAFEFVARFSLDAIPPIDYITYSMSASPFPQSIPASDLASYSCEQLAATLSQFAERLNALRQESLNERVTDLVSRITLSIAECPQPGSANASTWRERHRREMPALQALVRALETESEITLERHRLAPRLVQGNEFIKQISRMPSNIVAQNEDASLTLSTVESTQVQLKSTYKKLTAGLNNTREMVARAWGGLDAWGLIGTFEQDDRNARLVRAMTTETNQFMASLDERTGDLQREISATLLDSRDRSATGMLYDLSDRAEAVLADLNRDMTAIPPDSEQSEDLEPPAARSEDQTGPAAPAGPVNIASSGAPMEHPSPLTKASSSMLVPQITLQDSLSSSNVDPEMDAILMPVLTRLETFRQSMETVQNRIENLPQNERDGFLSGRLGHRSQLLIPVLLSQVTEEEAAIRVRRAVLPRGGYTREEADSVLQTVNSLVTPTATQLVQQVTEAFDRNLTRRSAGFMGGIAHNINKRLRSFIGRVETPALPTAPFQEIEVRDSLKNILQSTKKTVDSKVGNSALVLPEEQRVARAFFGSEPPLFIVKSFESYSKSLNDGSETFVGKLLVPDEKELNRLNGKQYLLLVNADGAARVTSSGKQTILSIEVNSPAFAALDKEKLRTAENSGTTQGVVQVTRANETPHFVMLLRKPKQAITPRASNPNNKRTNK